MRLKSIIEDEFGDLDDTDEFGTFRLEIDKSINTPEDWSHKRIQLYPDRSGKQIPDELIAIGQIIIGNINIALAESNNAGDNEIESWIIVNNRPLTSFDYHELYELCEELGYYTKSFQEFQFGSRVVVLRLNQQIVAYRAYLYDLLEELIINTLWRDMRIFTVINKNVSRNKILDGWKG